ncbi:FUSC family protein [Microbacterium sp. NPDC055910]|uniref:FUSC family protein n=1 Tax=Microbacterium sp. NPDC055910 TaxID=3345659 RepID=UPI0035E1DDA7
MHTPTPARPWRPSLWLRSLASTAPARWPVGRSIRTSISVAAPLIVASLLGHAVVGMWISMGSLLLAMGEHADAYPSRFRRILICAPIASASYLLGWLSGAPPVVTILVMTLLAFGGGILSGYSGPLSVATMQGMLTAAIAIGVPAAAPYWPAAVLFLAGAALYALLLGIEALFNRHRPQRDALAAVLRALADLSHTRAEGGDDVVAGRARTVAAIDTYAQMEIALRGSAQGPTREYARSALITRAADQLLARLLAHDVDRALCASAATRLTTAADAVASGHRPAARTSPDGALVRVGMLEDAIWGKSSAPADDAPPGRRVSAPSPELLMTAVRLALCTALAYIAFYLVPLAHPYWIALTVALVMKPDLGSVFARGVLRSAGTVGGAVIAIGVGAVIHEPLLLGAAVAVLAAVLPWAAARSYALQALLLTPLIMVLLTMIASGESVSDLSTARILTTVIGSAIVIVFGYLIWPSARHARIAAPFASSVAALTQYAGDVAAGKDAATITADRRRAYRTLSDTNVSVQRTLAEPPPAGREAWAWIPVVTAAERVADRITDASASRPPQDVSADLPALKAIAAELESFAADADVKERPVRVPAPPAHGGESADAVVRELADEVANLRPMLERRHPDRAEHGGRGRPSR